MYHADLRTELPRLGQMAAKVLDVHGEKHPDVLPALAATFRGLREELESHMMKEERVLFPYIERLEALAADGQRLPASPFGSIQASFAVSFAVWGLISAFAPRFRDLFSLSGTQTALLVALPVLLGSIGRFPVAAGGSSASS